MKCLICGKTITMKDWLNEKNIIKTDSDYFVAASKRKKIEKYVHKTCFEKQSHNRDYGK